jgi:hypothetical protein
VIPLAAVNLLEFCRLAVELAFLQVYKILIAVGMVLFVGIYFSEQILPPNPPSVSVTLLFHVLTAGLIYRFAHTIFHASRAAFGASLLFLFHPVTLDLVPTPDGWTTMASAPLLMASLIGFTRFMDAGSKGGYFLSLGFFGSAAFLSPYAVGFLWVLIVFTAYYRGLRDPKRLTKIFAGYFALALGTLFGYLPVLWQTSGPASSAPVEIAFIQFLAPVFSSVPFGLYPLLIELPFGLELAVGLFGLGLLVLFLKGWEDVRFLVLAFFFSYLSWYPLGPADWVPDPFPVYLSGIFFSILLPLCLHKADIRLYKKFLKPTHFFTLSLIVLWASYAALLRWEFFAG